jgi:hypothetical protein
MILRLFGDGYIVSAIPREIASKINARYRKYLIRGVLLGNSQLKNL